MAEKLTPTKKPRILVICQHFWPESFKINDICDYFVENNCDVEVLCGIPNYPKGSFNEGYGYFTNRRETHNGIKIRRAFEVPRGDNSNFRILVNYLSFPFFSLFHLPRLLFNKYDKIYLYQLSPVYMSVAGILLGKLKKIETTMYVLDLWPENLYSVLDIRNKFLRNILESTSHWHYRNVDKIITISEKMKKMLQDISNLPENDIIFIPQHGEKVYEKVEHDDMLEKRFSKGFNIVFAGNISPAQSFETILGAAKLVKEAGIRDINWIIVGDGMSRKWLEGEVTKAKLNDCFYFEGFKPMTEMPKYQTMADALVACLVKSPLLDCTIPAKVTSYLASGKPILLAMDGEAQDLVNNNNCGYAGPAEDSTALAENVIKLYESNPADRSKMGENSKRIYFEKFERSVNLKKLYNFIFIKRKAK